MSAHLLIGPVSTVSRNVSCLWLIHIYSHCKQLNCWEWKCVVLAWRQNSHMLRTTAWRWCAAWVATCCSLRSFALYRNGSIMHLLTARLMVGNACFQYLQIVINIW